MNETHSPTFWDALQATSGLVLVAIAVFLIVCTILMPITVLLINSKLARMEKELRDGVNFLKQSLMRR